MFSFVMHGGCFDPVNDRYDHVSPSDDGDMFDAHDDDRGLRVQRKASRCYHVGIDLKASHLRKSRGTGLYRHVVQAAPAPLPFRAGSFRTVFLYFPHGLVERGEVVDYAATLREIRRVVRDDGTLLMMAMNRDVTRHFVWHAWSDRLERAGWGRAAAYCRRLDAGRHHEIGSFARSMAEWRALLTEAGFNLKEVSSQVLPSAWRLYDVQTRPFLRLLIRASCWTRGIGLKPLTKSAWVYLWLPMLAACYSLWARPKSVSPDDDAPDRLVFAFNAAASSRTPPVQAAGASRVQRP